MTLAPREVVEAPAREWRSYPEYKDSGIEWLGEIPAHWDVQRNRFIFQEVDDRSISGDETLLSLSKTRGLLPRSKITDKVARADTLVGYKRCAIGDVVMNKMQAWNGVFGYAGQAGIVSPDYTVFRCYRDVHATYFAYLFTTSLYISEFKWRSRGMGTAFLRLNTPDFSDVVSLLPLLPEQQIIAAFLDRETRKIDDLISKREHLIELLEEKRTALISRAVTKGLDPGVPMKDSGVEWLGEIPEHWTLMALRRLLTGIEQGWSPVAEDREASREEVGRY